jgi:hypothetical protein
LYDSPNLLNTFERRNEGTTQKEVAANKKEYEEKMNVKPGDRDAKPPMPFSVAYWPLKAIGSRHSGTHYKRPYRTVMQPHAWTSGASPRMGFFCRSEDNFFVVAEKKPATAFGTYRSPARACDRSHD